MSERSLSRAPTTDVTLRTLRTTFPPMLKVPPTILRALLPADADASLSAVVRRLDALGVLLRPDPEAGCRWRLSGDFEGLAVEIAMQPADALTPHAHGEPRGLEEAAEARYELVIQATLGDDPLGDYHRLVRLAVAAAPDLLLLVDDACHTARFPTWAHEVAACGAPPAPSALYSLHRVERGGKVWMHTHGLLRAGALDVELIAPAKACTHVAPLLHAVAAQWLEQGPPCPGEPFDAGRDLSLLWVPWPKVAAKQADGPGGATDRDDAHSEPSAVLFAADRGVLGMRPRCLSVLSEVLGDDPLLYVTRAETERMAWMARDRWPLFARAVRHHGDEAGYRFLAKLGYECPRDPTQREHVWAEVHHATATTLDATILSRPRLAPFEPGDRREHELSRVSDWLVVTPHGDVGPSDACALEED